MVRSFTRRSGEKITIGGLDEKMLKKEKGLRFIFPFLPIVDTNAIGLGAIKLVR
jgi:hypothetical protein